MLCRSAPHSLRSMQAGLLAGNREFSSCQVSGGGVMWIMVVWDEYSEAFELLVPMNFMAV